MCVYVCVCVCMCVYVCVFVCVRLRVRCVCGGGVDVGGWIYEGVLCGSYARRGSSDVLSVLLIS